jgi:histidyl-tRNA synthetase
MTKSTNRKTRQEDKNKKTSQPKSMPRYASMEKAAKIAEYYGFSLLPKIQVTRHDMHVARQLRCPLDQQSPFAKINTDELSAILHAYADKKLFGSQQPPMFYYEGVLPRENEYSGSAVRQLTLDIIGSSKSISEAALIHTAYTILTEEYKEDMVVELNSLGDRDSAIRFNRELNSYYKKASNELPTSLRNLLKSDPSLVVTSDNPKAKELAINAPQSISCLSESSRTQFKEVLEFMETLNIPYRINPKLIANRNIYYETVFVIRRANTNAEEEPCAIGFRYNPVSRKIGYKKEVPAARVVICLPKAKIGHIKKTENRKPKKALFYFVHIGFEAKLKSLNTLEILRQACLPVVYSLIKDTLTHQLIHAEQCAVPYILLMGQKESMEHTVLVRATKNSSQETISLEELPKHLKKLK